MGTPRRVWNHISTDGYRKNNFSNSMDRRNKKKKINYTKNNQSKSFSS